MPEHAHPHPAPTRTLLALAGRRFVTLTLLGLATTIAVTIAIGLWQSPTISRSLASPPIGWSMRLGYSPEPEFEHTVSVDPLFGAELVQWSTEVLGKYPGFRLPTPTFPSGSGTSPFAQPPGPPLTPMEILKLMTRVGMLHHDDFPPRGAALFLGWPQPSLRLQNFMGSWLWNRPHLIFRDLVANIAFYAAIWWVVLIVVGDYRRRHRLQRHQCPKCAYDLRGQTSPGCPECGAGRPAAKDDPASGHPC